MLKWIELEGVGPAPRLRIDLAERLSVLTGDNGLGKTFLLDVAWWALTCQWPGRPGWPRPDAEQPTIRYSFRGHEHTIQPTVFLRDTEVWQDRSVSGAGEGLALYARVDGGFCTWDAFRNRDDGGLYRPPRPGYRPSVHFDDQQVWNGLEVDGRRRCEGLIRDWVSWQRGKMPEFEQLRTVLRTLSTEEEPLTPAEPQRVSLDDGFDTPCIATRYGVVPLTHASAAVRRIVGLAYLLVWAWREHCIAAKLLRRQPVRKILLLVDEPETHLHPKWQRLILPALLAAVKKLLASESVDLQILTATHSPLVLASLEPHFDVQKDSLFELEYAGEGADATVQLSPLPWVRHGDAAAWLRSEPFGLQSGGYSPEAERALEEAAHALSTDNVEPEVVRQLDAKLRNVLGEMDPFWIRWRFMAETRGWLR
jgi:hypothetical protein